MAEISQKKKDAVEKGEIACYKQSITCPQCFQNTLTANMFTPGIVWKRTKEFEDLFVIYYSDKQSNFGGVSRKHEI